MSPQTPRMEASAPGTSAPTTIPQVDPDTHVPALEQGELAQVSQGPASDLPQEDARPDAGIRTISPSANTPSEERSPERRGLKRPPQDSAEEGLRPGGILISGYAYM